MNMNYNIANIKLKVAIGCFLLLPLCMKAQQADTVSALRQYINASNAYKRVPMYTSALLTTSSNLAVTGGSPDTTIVAESYLVKDGAYIKFGEMEQLVNDSLLLMVSNNSRHMMLVANKMAISASLKNSPDEKMQDSSIDKMIKKYTAVVEPEQKGIITITVNTRMILAGTSQARETVVFRYKKKDGEPVDVKQTRRMLVSIDSSQYNSFAEIDKNKPYLIEQGDAYFFVREQVSDYQYKKIEYGDKVHLPVQISDRVVKNAAGEYVPAKGYETFIIGNR
jgi:hypothetical protein